MEHNTAVVSVLPLLAIPSAGSNSYTAPRHIFEVKEEEENL